MVAVSLKKKTSQKLPGPGWSAPQLIETDNTFGTATPDVAVDANGNAMAVWGQGDGTRSNILANRYEPVGKLGGQWGFPQLVEFFNGLVGGVTEALR